MRAPQTGCLFDLLDFEPTPPPVPPIDFAPKTPRPIKAALSFSRRDWPGRRSASVVLSGCDFSCPYCFDPEHVGSQGSSASVATLAEQLSAKSADLDGVVVTGGEPTSSEALLQLLRELTAAGLPVKLDTNGAAPETLETLLAENLVSFVALDVKTTPPRYDRMVGSDLAWPRIERSISAVITSGVDHEFRTTCYPFGLQIADLPSIAALLKGGQRYVLQQFVARRTLDPAASSAVPWPADELRRAAVRCSVHIPTVVRGV